jgi:hypothetical protein
MKKWLLPASLKQLCSSVAMLQHCMYYSNISAALFHVPNAQLTRLQPCCALLRPCQLQLSSGSHHRVAAVLVCTRRHTHGCAAAVDGADTFVESSRVDQEAVVDGQPANVHVHPAQETQDGLNDRWSSFLQQLWDRGCFKEHSSSNM